MPRLAKATLTVNTGNSGHDTFASATVESYQTSQAIDVDSDSFSVQLGNVQGKLNSLLDRDNEVIVRLSLEDTRGNSEPLFTGIVDVAVLGEDLSVPLTGRDLPTSVALDSDALPGRWRHMRPDQFIAARAKNLGIKITEIAEMRKMASFYTDASEKEWALWYRLARMRDMYMWSDSRGALIIDKPGYSMKPTYYIGEPSEAAPWQKWLQAEPPATLTSTKQNRLHKVVIYGTDTKKGQTRAAQAIDPHINSWLKKPVTILSSTKHRSQSELQKLAQAEVFEGIVGATEFVVAIRDADVAVQQNEMALVNLPSYGYENELMYVVGVERQGDTNGNMIQTIRLREKGFALTHRVPDAPSIGKSQGGSANDKSLSSISAALSSIQWADSFIRATHEFGDAWDFAVFCAVLMAIVQVESGFHNIREETTTGGFHNGEEWKPMAKWVISPGPDEFPHDDEASLEFDFRKIFANEATNPLNPFHARAASGEAGVGPFQLTDLGSKQWADQYGWNGKSLKDEYIGGRWNPDSNIRAGARDLVSRLHRSPMADPTNADSIWLGVGRRAGGTDGDAGQQAYIAKVKKQYKAFFDQVSQALAQTQTLPPGTSTRIVIPGHGALKLPANTPDEVRKAINWALRHLDDPYKWGGYGPYYDCSSFVTGALAHGSAALKAKLDPPDQQTAHHGDNTYTLFRKGRFKSVTKDALKPGDLVFFLGPKGAPDHVVLYLADGFFIQDPTTGSYVGFDNMNSAYWRSAYQGARRVADWPGHVSRNEPGAN